MSISDAYESSFISNTDPPKMTLHRTWEKAEDQPNKYYWDNVDKIYQYAQQHNLGFRGHGAVGWETAPQWTKDLDANSLREAIRSHVYNLVKRYPKMISLVVVNEPMFGSWH